MIVAAKSATGQVRTSGDGPAGPRRPGRRLAICAPLTVATIVSAAVPTAEFTGSPWLGLVLAAPVATWGAWPVYQAAWRGLGRRPATATTLAGLVGLAAWCWSAYGLLFGHAAAASGPVVLTSSLGGPQPAFSAVAAGVTTAVLAGQYLEERAGLAAGSTQQQADRIAAVLVPCVLTLAVVTLGFWLGTGLPAGTALSASVAVLVVACPCALTLAGPAALAAAAGLAADLGIRIRHAPALAGAGRLRIIVLDAAAVLTADALHPRPGAAAAVTRLRNAGLVPLMLTSGDDACAVAAAAALGLRADQVISTTGAAERAELITRLRVAGQAVAMAGDAASDAGALAAADLGLAISVAPGVPAAGGLALASDDPGGIADALRLARAVSALSRVSLCWALGYNLFAIPLAALGYLSSLLSVIVMVASSLVVVANSLLLRRFRPRRGSG